MKNLGVRLIALLTVAPVLASDLNVRVTSQGASAVKVSPGALVLYEIRGVLGDAGEIILASGVLTSPDDEGDYIPELSELFASATNQSEAGVALWASEAAEVGTVENLVVHVQDCDVHLVSPSPGTNRVLWRSAKNTLALTFDQNIMAPTAEMIHIETLEPEGEFGETNLSSGFTYTIENNSVGLPRVLRIREIAKSLTNRTWYGVRNVGDWPGICNFEAVYLVGVGDANGDRLVTPSDISLLSTRSGPQSPNSRFDINGDGFATPTDVSIANASGGGPPPPKPSGH